jgi:dipeptidyl aminopeptidase/acylaminoacyl peptidase
MLLWHGMQADARFVVRPLASSLADRGAFVIVPDWNSHAADGGRADLLGSLNFAAEQAGDSDRMVLIGWSLGGAAAASLTLAATRFDVVLTHTVCLAGAFMVPDPIRGRVLTEDLSRDDVGSTPFTLLHGVADDAVPVQASRAFAAGLERVGWPVDLVEFAADHGSIAGAEYDPAADRYRPAQGGRPLQLAHDVADRIVSAIAR